MPRPRHGGKAKPNGETANMASSFGGKLSLQVTDEGTLAGHFPLIRRAGATAAHRRSFPSASPHFAKLAFSETV